MDDFSFSETKVKYDWDKPPAITIATWKTKLETGWKKAFRRGENLKTNCETTQDFDTMVACIDDKTFQLSEVLEEAISGDETERNITNATLWSEDLSNFDLGKVHTLNSSFQIGKDSRQLTMNFKNDQNYTIFIHDPKYFMFTENPDTIPQIRVIIDDSKIKFFYIKAIYHQFLDKPGNPCESSESYSFTACIKNSLSRQIGCRLPWDAWTSKIIPVCRSVDQLVRFEEEYEKIDTWGPQSILEFSGCHPPCTYTEYILASHPKNNGEKPGIRASLSNSKVLMRTEEILYPMESFVSEFGGALGLFLGFSFIMVWDALAHSVANLLNFIKVIPNE